MGLVPNNQLGMTSQTKSAYHNQKIANPQDVCQRMEKWARLDRKGPKLPIKTDKIISRRKEPLRPANPVQFLFSGTTSF